MLLGQLDRSIPFGAGLAWLALMLSLAVIGVREYGAAAKREYFNDPDDWGYVYPFMDAQRKFSPEGLRWYNAQRRYYTRSMLLLLAAWIALDWHF